MFKNLIESIKLSKVSYLLEIIRVRDFQSKINAFNKLKQMKITKDMGLLILEETNFEHEDTYSDFNISLSLISLLFKDYHSEYSDKLYEIYPKLTLNSKYEVLNLLANNEMISAINLYTKLVVKYGKELNDIPVGLLGTNKNNYNLLFPDLFKTLKFDIRRNPVLLLLSDFINMGTAKEEHIKKNKKLIQTSIINILKEGVNFKFNKDENVMQNKDYLSLRIFLEAIINIEYYVSNKDTKQYLDKLLKKKDNQLKLFVLENYLKKEKDISKINLNTIARDNLSRYPLYSFLKFYNLENLMPKKYANNISLSESDLYVNYAITYKYSSIPENLKLIDEKIVNDYKYYIYEFETKFNYLEEVKDPATDYILKTTKIDEKIIENSKVKYIGISGGFNKDLDPSLIEKNLPNLLVKKYSDDYNKVIEELLPKKGIILPLDLNKAKKKKLKVKNPKKKEKKKLFKIKDKEYKVKEQKIKVKKQKKIKIKEQEIYIEELEPSILRKILSFNTLLILVCTMFLGSALLLISYLNGGDILNLKNTSTDYDNLKILKSSPIKNENYKEINYQDIFKQGQSDYYVLLYKKGEKSVYHNYVNTIIDNKYTVYYVNLNKEENKKIYEGNETGFIISDDTLLKVRDGEYEFFVVGKTNILKELRDYIDTINKQKEEEAKKKKEEAKQKQKEKLEKEKEEKEQSSKEKTSKKES